MILQALYDYYQKHQQELPCPGFENKEFKYMIVIREDGSFDYLECLITETETKKKTGQFFSVPQGQGRSGKNSWQTAYLLWDHYGYVLGYAKSDTPKDIETAERQHKQFVEQIRNLPESIKQLPEIQAVIKFYDRAEEKNVMASPEWQNCKKIPGCNLSFRLKEQQEPVFTVSAFRNYVAEAATLENTQEDGTNGCCLVSGKRSNLCRLMRQTPIAGGQATASLVSFQKNSGYDSYGKEQCFNAPISQDAEFRITTALNSLLSKESKNKFMFGDTTAVFWVEKDTSFFDFETLIPALAQQSKDSATENVEAMRKLCEAAYRGRLPEDCGIRYYFLGLSPNSARISVRFWKTGTVGELAVNIARHFRDLEIIGGPEYPALTSLLTGVVHEHKMENVPPNLIGRMFEAIFNDTDYPDTWRNLCLQCVHADGKVTPLRASVLKACSNRKNRLRHTTQNYKEISMSFDPENSNAAYQCGALFALLVKAQEEANPGLNATISDRYFASASTRPAAVFGTLMRLNRTHLKKLNPGRVIRFEQMMGAIINKLGTQFPGYLSPDQQSRFCLGYYQKRHELFTSKKDTEEQENANN